MYSVLLSLESPNDVQSVANTHRTFKRLAKALIGLRECAGWSEYLPVAHATSLEISCQDSSMDVDKDSYQY